MDKKMILKYIIICILIFGSLAAALGFSIHVNRHWFTAVMILTTSLIYTGCVMLTVKWEIINKKGQVSNQEAISKETFRNKATEFLKFLAKDHDHKFMMDKEALDYWIDNHEKNWKNNG
jgi:hypothetical protein